jgi:nitrate/nitrite-specific signal transduction histidine kinase
VLSVRDDGCGIAQEVLTAGEKEGHWGLPGMRERAEKLGAELRVFSQPGEGTCVALRVPAARAYLPTSTRISILSFGSARRQKDKPTG